MPDSTAVTVVEVFIFVERLIERIRELECHAMQARGVVRCAVFFECLDRQQAVATRPKECRQPYEECKREVSGP